MTNEEKIRVLIVDDNTEMRDNLRRLIQFDPIIEVSGVASNGSEGIDKSKKLQPDVVIMDINMPDMDGIKATDAIRKINPFTQIIILSVQSDPNYMRRAMLAGARDFLPKPPSIDELTAAIKRAGKIAQEERTKVNQVFTIHPGTGGLTGGLPSLPLGKVIVFYSPKGGTGCTTIATNYACALKNSDNKILIIDANLQFGDIPIFFNEQIRNSILDLTPLANELDPGIIEDVVTKHTSSGIDFIAAPPKPEMGEQVEVDQFIKVVDYLKNFYTHIIIDTASYLTNVVQAAIEVADIISLITTQDIPSIKNSNEFLNLADVSDINREMIVFILNKYDKRISISPDRISDSLHQKIELSIPFDEKSVSNSINRGIPLFLENKSSPFSKSIISLTQLITEKIKSFEDDIG